MKKREREITALYGLSLIKNDVLKFPYPPKLTLTEKINAAIHWLALMSPVMVIIALCCVYIWSAKFF